eukprot:277997_1
MNLTLFVLSIISLIILTFQFVCLYAFTYLFGYYWCGQQTMYTKLFNIYNLDDSHWENLYDLDDSLWETKYDKDWLNAFSVWIVIAISTLILCYLIHYSYLFISSFWAYYNIFKNNPHKIHKYNYTISLLLIWLNMGLIFSIWVCVTWVISLGYYYNSLITSNILMFPIICVFILSINQWIYLWIISKCISIPETVSNHKIKSKFWTINYRNQYSNAVIIIMIIIVFIFISWIFAWFFVANSAWHGYNMIFWVFPFGGWSAAYQWIFVGCISTVIIFLLPSNVKSFIIELFCIVVCVIPSIVMLLYINTLKTVSMNYETQYNGWYDDRFGENGYLDIKQIENVVFTCVFLFQFALVFCGIHFVLFVYRCFYGKHCCSSKYFEIVIAVMSPVICFISVMYLILSLDSLNQSVYSPGQVFFILFLIPVAFVVNVTDSKQLMKNQ